MPVRKTTATSGANSDATSSDKSAPPEAGTAKAAAATAPNAKTTTAASAAGAKAAAAKTAGTKPSATKSAGSRGTPAPGRSGTGKPAASKPTATRSGGKPGGGKPGPRPAGKSASAARSAAALRASKPPTGGKNKSIVNQRQTPWGLIITTVLIVAFAAAVVVAVVVQHKSSSSKSDNPYTQPEPAAVKAIGGVIYKQEPDHNHVTTTVQYDSSPPVGGNHSPYWADCSGTVYAAPIANENAVHMLEHGAVWITYREGLPAEQLNILKQLVSGVDRMALSPYPNLKTPISLQSWNYQLFVNNASDPRVQQFIAALKFNPATTPEQNATCSQPPFKAHPSTFGHPLFAPATS